MEQKKRPEDCTVYCKETVGLIDMIAKQFKRYFPLVDEGDSGLTNVQRQVLRFILMETIDHEIYQKDVEEKFHIRRSTATGILKLMEKNGFIHRESVERDMRLKKISPTDKAIALREEILESIRSLENQMSQGIGKEEFEICLSVLKRLSANLSAGEERGKKEKGGNDEQKAITINQRIQA